MSSGLRRPLLANAPKTVQPYHVFPDNSALTTSILARRTNSATVGLRRGRRLNLAAGFHSDAVLGVCGRPAPRLRREPSLEHHMGR